jgi:hypothetical protein
VYRLATEGILPSVVVARRMRKNIVRFRQETIEKFVRDREHNAKS